MHRKLWGNFFCSLRDFHVIYFVSRNFVAPWGPKNLAFAWVTLAMFFIFVVCPRSKGCKALISESVKCRFSKCRFSAELLNLEKIFEMGGSVEK